MNKVFVEHVLRVSVNLSARDWGLNELSASSVHAACIINDKIKHYVNECEFTRQGTRDCIVRLMTNEFTHLGGASEHFLKVFDRVLDAIYGEEA